MQAPCIASGVAAAFLLHGCADTHSQSDTPTSDPSTTSIPAGESNTNIWQFRNDEDMGLQTTFDINAGNFKDSTFYGGCYFTNEAPGLVNLTETVANKNGPVADQFTEDGNTYGSYDDEVGVTLLNKRNSSNKAGCLMRKSRVPVDLSEIGRIELDITTKGSSDDAPWYSVWLAPMLYVNGDDESSTKAAEIDLIENFPSDPMKWGFDVNEVKTTFAQCGQPGEFSWTESVCKAVQWSEPAGHISAHITLKALTEDGKRVLRVYHCSQPATQCDDNSEYAEIKVDSDPPGDDIDRNEWFPVWNKDVAKEWYAKYWLIADIWWTSGTDFELSVGNVRFYSDNDTEWKMPLDGPPPSDTMSRGDDTTAAPGPDDTTAAPGPDDTTAAPGANGNCCEDGVLDCCQTTEGCCSAAAADPLDCCQAASAEMV